MGPEIRVQYEKAVEAQIVCPGWWAGTEIDGAEYVFLGRKDKSTAGEGLGGVCGFFESWLFVCRGEERNPA